MGMVENRGVLVGVEEIVIHINYISERVEEK